MEFHTPTRSYQYAYSSSFILKDYGGAIIKGSCDVRDREGSIEVLSFTHGLHIPVDGNTGKQTGTRVNGSFAIGKEFVDLPVKGSLHGTVIEFC